jgi:hypothetical protein
MPQPSLRAAVPSETHGDHAVVQRRAQKSLARQVQKITDQLAAQFGGFFVHR